MDDTTGPRVEVMWRPGCPYCSRLRRGLRKAGVETVEHDIWADPAAAARVRTATGGDETVPTVVIGRQTLVNPSVAQVQAGVRAEFPADPEPPSTLEGSRPAGRAVWTGVWWTGVWWTAAAAVLWVVLAVWQPTTTWHLAPVLLAAAWAWVIGQDVRCGDRAGAVRVAVAALAGFVVTVAVTLGLAGARPAARTDAMGIHRRRGGGVGARRRGGAAGRAAGCPPRPADRGGALGVGRGAPDRDV